MAWVRTQATAASGPGHGMDQNNTSHRDSIGRTSGPFGLLLVSKVMRCTRQSISNQQYK